MPEAANRFWSGGRNVCQSQCGEYYPSSGYAFTRTLLRSVPWRDSNYGSGFSSQIDVIAKLTVAGRARGQHHFSCSVAVHGQWQWSVDIHRGLATSVQSAKRQSFAALTDSRDFAGEALAKYYSLNKLYVKRPGEVEPFVCLFDTWTSSLSLLNYGEYTATDADGSTFEICRSGCSISTSCQPKRVA
jgi:hypothetical protein